jgi:hypothetical protein
LLTFFPVSNIFFRNQQIFKCSYALSSVGFKGGTMLSYIKYLLFFLLALVLAGCAGNGATSGDPLGTDSITVSADLTTLSAGQTTIIRATVIRASGLPATDRTVSFIVGSNNSRGTISATEVRCDGQNKAAVYYTAGAAFPASNVQDVITVRISNDASVPVVITRVASTGGGGAAPQIALLSASPAAVSVGQSSIITANVTDGTGNPVIGEAVSFSIPPDSKHSGSPTLSAASSVTDGSGRAITIYTPGISSPTASVTDVIQASISNGSTGTVIVARNGQTSTANTVTISSSDSSIPIKPGDSRVITALVTDASGNPVSGITVTFNLSIHPSGALFDNGTTVESAITGANGKAIIFYTAGPTATQTDVIKASITSADAALVMFVQ